MLSCPKTCFSVNKLTQLVFSQRMDFGVIQQFRTNYFKNTILLCESKIVKFHLPQHVGDGFRDCDNHQASVTKRKTRPTCVGRASE